MKKIIFSILFPVALCAACKNKTKMSAGFISGTYVNQAQSEFSIANDTLVITSLAGDNYQVLRKTGFRRIMGGQMQPEEHRSKMFNGTWNEQKQNLQIAQNGIIIVFLPDSSQLLVQNSKYRKLGRGL